MSNYRILLVEDEEHLLEALKLNLELVQDLLFLVEMFQHYLH